MAVTELGKWNSLSKWNANGVWEPLYTLRSYGERATQLRVAG